MKGWSNSNSAMVWILGLQGKNWRGGFRGKGEKANQNLTKLVSIFDCFKSRDLPLKSGFGFAPDFMIRMISVRMYRAIIHHHTLTSFSTQY